MGNRTRTETVNIRVTGASIIVSRQSFLSQDPYDVIQSNLSFVNYLLQEHFRPDELSRAALVSYYVDYYLSQVNNGGFSQFVYNSRWAPGVIDRVRGGLLGMKADRHLEVFEQGAALVASLGDAALHDYFASEYFGDNPTRDMLNTVNDAFYAIGEAQDLIQLNAAWIRKHPDLVVLTIAQMKDEIDRRIARMVDRDARVASALDAEPRYMKLIRALTVKAGQDLSAVTAGDPSHVYEGKQMLAWHFITDAGQHYMLDLGDEALMFDEAHNELARIPASNVG